MTSDANWRQPLKWARKARETGTRPRVFCASLADVFENRKELEHPRLRLFSMIRDTPELDWLLLTKRPENMVNMLPVVHLENPWPNLWLGTTVEDQRRADERIPHLLNTPAVVRFLSCEPLLGPVNLDKCYRRHDAEFCDHEDVGIDWVICGGESGHGARPMHPDWARSLRDWCQAAGVPFFFKQHGEWIHQSQQEKAKDFPNVVADGANGCPEGGYPESRVYRWDDGTESYRAGKANAGRLLDGREWSEFPQ